MVIDYKKVCKKCKFPLFDLEKEQSICNSCKMTEEEIEHLKTCKTDAIACEKCSKLLNL